MITAQPTKPSSSPATLKMKSVCWLGTKFAVTSEPWNRPLPNSPPEPIVILACAALYPLPLRVGRRVQERGQPVQLVGS